MKNLLVSFRLAIVSSFCCCVLYTMLLSCFAQLLVPKKASGQLLRDYKGQLVGSRMIAQKFESDKYFHGRPAQDGKGSNLSPTSAVLKKRFESTVQEYHATEQNPLPADLAMGSGSGLDPHITVNAAKYQVPRIAGARKLSEGKVNTLIESSIFYPCRLLDSTALVNVLELNLHLDELERMEAMHVSEGNESKVGK